MEKSKKEFLMKRFIMSIVICTMLLSNFPVMVSANTAVEKVEGNQEDNSQEVTQSNHLDDYSQMYGMEPISHEPQVKLNKKARSTNPQKVAYIAVFVEFNGMDTVSLDDPDAVKAAEMVFNKGGVNTDSSGKNEKPISSLQDYMKKYSYGKLEVEGSIFPKDNNGKVISYTSPKPREYFKTYHAVNNKIGYKNRAEKESREKELVDGAMASIKSSVEKEFTAQEIDTGNDGSIDAISFFTEAPNFSDREDIEWGDLLWSHKSTGNSNVKIHGKSILAYNIVNTPDPKGLASSFSYLKDGNDIKLRAANYGVIHHEYFHILGLPDLYRGTASGTPVGFYDIMATTREANPQGITAIMQRDWLTFGNKLEEVSKTKEITLKRPQYKDATEKVAIKIFSPLNDKEYFVVEFYQRQENQTSTQGRGDGLIVYRINNNTNSSNINGGTDGLNDYMYIFRPNESSLGSAAGSLSDAVILPTVGNTYGKSNIDPSGAWDKDSIYFSDGKNSGIELEIKDSTKDEITFKVNMPDVKGTGTISDPYLISEPSDFNLMIGSGNKHFKLTKDIDFTGFSFSGVPSLSGSFDGNHKKLSNITLNQGTGFFGDLDYGSSVKDLEIENINVNYQGDNHVGSLAGSVAGTVSNVVVTSGRVNVSAANSTGLAGTGGFVGTATDSAVIENSSTSANVTGGINTGGFVGLNQNAKFKDSFANGSVVGTDKTGGFIGSEFIMGTLIDPENCAYDMRATGQSIAQSGKDIKGITGYQVTDKITLDLASVNEASILLETKPVVSLVKPTIEVSETNIARFDDTKQKIVGVSIGKTFANANIKVGKNNMPLKIDIEVIDSNPNKPITSITLKSTLGLNVGEEEILVATINPTDASDKTITWTSSDGKVAKVDNNGKVTALKAGTTNIVVTAKNGVSATCVVTIKNPITSITLDKQTLTMDKGTETTLKATINPSDTTDDKTLTWTSSDGEVAKVDNNGKVTALKAGTTNIKVTAKNGVSATCVVNVKGPIISITLDKQTLTMNKGTETTLKATINPSETTDDKTLTWKSSKESVAKVDAFGKVQAITAGTTTITVTTSNNLSATCVVTVETPITSITLDKPTLTMNKGTEATLQATINPSDATMDKTLTWTTSKESVVTVDGSGKIQAMGAGTATITVTTSNNLKATSEITVLSPITSITLDKPTLNMERGTEATLQATINPSDTTDDKKLTWSSSNESVAKVDAFGKVQAMGPGKATITVKTVNGMQATSEVAVNISAVSIVMNMDSVSLTKGKSALLIASLLPSDATDAVTFSWSSKDPLIASVDQNGNVTANKTGETSILVTATLKPQFETRSGLTLQTTVKITVVESLFEQITNEYNDAFTKVNDPTFIDGAPISFIDNLNQQIKIAKDMIDLGEGNTTDEDILSAISELKSAVNLFSKVSNLNELQRLMNVDLTIYDQDTTKEFIAMKQSIQDILNDPLNKQDLIDSELVKFQALFNQMVKLDRSELNIAITNAEAIDLSNYLDGVSKKNFLTALENAKKALGSTANREFKEAADALNRASEELIKVQIASKEQLDMIGEQIKILEEMLNSYKYSFDNKKAIEDMLAKAKKALNDNSLLFVDAQSLLAQLEQLKSVQPEKEDTLDKDKVNTADYSNTTTLYFALILSLLLASSSYIMIKLKDRN